MIKAFYRNRTWLLWAYGGGALLLFSIGSQVFLLARLNEWYGAFYDMLQEATKHPLSEFWVGIYGFMRIALPYILIVTLTNYFSRMYALRWREALTFSYIPRWQRVSLEFKIEGASQRIQEDAYRFARIIETLGLQVTKSVMLLVAFLPILWRLSANVVLPPLPQIPWLLIGAMLVVGVGLRFVSKIKDIKYRVTTGINVVLIVFLFLLWNVLSYPHSSGSLVWIALIVSIGGMQISWFVGGKLPGLEYNNQKVEAAFRKELVLGEDALEHRITPTLTELFTGIRFNYHRLFLHYGYFDIWANVFSQTMVIVPYLIAGPALFSGAIMLGVLIQVSNAFDKVQQSMSIFIENWTTVTELRSIWKRLHEFEANLKKYEVVAA